MEVPHPVIRLRRQAHKPRGEGRERRDEQEILQALDRVRPCVLKPVSPTVTLQISECFLDLHALLVCTDNAPGRPGVRCQGRGQEPWLASVSPLALVMRHRVRRPTRPAWSPRQRCVQMEGARVRRRRGAPAFPHVQGAVRRPGVKRARVCPQPDAIATVLHFVAHPPNPIPSQGFYGRKPRSAKPRISDHDRAAC